MEKIEGKVKFDYDKENDVLYSYIDKPVKAINKELDSGVVVRLDPVSKKMVGFTIVDYLFKRKKGLLNKLPCVLSAELFMHIYKKG